MKLSADLLSVIIPRRRGGGHSHYHHHHHHHHHHESLFIHEIVSFYMVFLGIMFKTRLKLCS